MAATRRTLKDGSKFWDYIDWADLTSTIQKMSVGVTTSGPLYDILSEIVETDETGNFYVRGDVNQDRSNYDNERFVTSADVVQIYGFGIQSYENIDDTPYDNILNYILYSEDLQKYYGAPSSWTAVAAASAIFYNADTGDTVPSLATASGPLLFKHGTISADLGEGVTQTAVTFDTPFPAALYGIQLQIKIDASTTMDAFEAYVKTSDVNGFTWQIASSSASSFGTGTIYWLAYGN